jgi:hypothetical protein
LREIERLKNKQANRKKKEEEIPNKTTEDEAIEDSEPGQDEEEILLSSKRTGFLRDGPQYQPQPKPPQEELIGCDICEEHFISNKMLKKHKLDHENEGAWNCDDCSYQTNEKSNLTKHVGITKHQSHKLETNSKQVNRLHCNLCDETFTIISDLTRHRRTHKTFKPCKNLPKCQYENECVFNHDKIEDNDFICYECGEKFSTLKELMPHRKANHKMNACTKFLKNECRFTESKCWYNHEAKNKIEKEKNDTKSPKKMEKANKINEPLGFWEPPANLAPPSLLPSQAAWIKMTTMMRELNQMMVNLKHHNQPFQSL